MYNIYYNKQQPSNITSSPNTDIGIAQSPQFNTGAEQNSILGIGAAGAVVIPTINRIIDTSLNARGDIGLQIAVDNGRKVVGGLFKFAAIAKLANPLAALGSVVLDLSLKRYEKDLDETLAQIDNSYNRQKQGVAVNQFSFGGMRYD